MNKYSILIECKYSLSLELLLEYGLELFTIYVLSKQNDFLWLSKGIEQSKWSFLDPILTGTRTELNDNC